MSKKGPQVAPCPHRPPCPGCPQWGDAGVPEEKLGVLEALARREGLAPPEPLTGGAEGHRRRARLAIRGRSNAPKIGIFQEGSHRIADIPRCLIHHPEINRVAAALKSAIRVTRVTPYADRPHKGLLRYLQVSVSRRDEKLQVTLVTNDDQADAIQKTAEILGKQVGDNLSSLWWNGQTQRSNAVFGPHWSLLSGDERLVDDVLDAEVHYHPGAFSQANPELFDRIVAMIREEVPPRSKTLELYAGVGGIGLNLLDKVESLTFNEVSGPALNGLEISLAARPEAQRNKVEIVRGPAGGAAAWIKEHQVVIADPPRKGLDAEVLDALLADPPDRVILVACGFQAFQRDAARLLRRFSLRRLVPVALFPYSDHVETFAVFDRAT